MSKGIRVTSAATRFLRIKRIYGRFDVSNGIRVGAGDDFQRRYLRDLEDSAAQGSMTLVYSVHNPLHNYARVLVEYLETNAEGDHAKPAK